MWKLLRKTLIIAGTVAILLSGGCDSYAKTDYAPDALFVISSVH